MECRIDGWAYIDSIVSFLGDVSNGTQRSWRQHNLMIVNQRVLIYTTKYVSTRYVVSNLLQLSSDVRGMGRAPTLNVDGLKSH